MLKKNIPACLLVAVLVSVAAMADDLTKMIQEDLTALGYDPGNVQGEASTETVVAISQFQAENNLEVTGEASPQLAGVIKAKLDERNDATTTALATAAQPMDPAALQAAQQACLKEKVEAAQATQKKKRGFGSLMRAVTNTAVRFAGGNDFARQVQETSNEIYKADATAKDWERAAKDLGLTESDLEACRNPGGGATSISGNSGNTTEPQDAMQGLTPEQRQALEQSGMGGMFERMMGGAGSGQPSALSQPDKNIVPADEYRFSHRVTMRITTDRGTAEPVFYVQPDASYYARMQSTDGLTEILVYDNERNLVALYGEQNGDRGMAHSRMSLETRATLIGAYRDAPQKAPIRSLGSKKFLGYASQGYEFSTVAGTTEIWVTNDAPGSLFGTMFENRGLTADGTTLGRKTMVMEVKFTSAQSPEDSYHMVCTEVQPDELVVRKTDYQS